MGVRDSKLEQDGVLIRDLYAEHAAALLAYLRRMLGGDRYLAEDIVQETTIPPNQLTNFDVITGSGHRLIRLAMPTRTA
jgi:hypothetical protein